LIIKTDTIPFGRRSALFSYFRYSQNFIRRAHLMVEISLNTFLLDLVIRLYTFLLDIGDKIVPIPP